jgi:hypothetical protein
MTHRLLRILTLSVFSSLLLVSCIDESRENIPSYVAVDHSILQVNEGFSGSASHRIADVWLYANEDLIGVFETPVDIPVLDEGLTDFRFKAGIMVNGISDSRRAYEFYNPYETEAVLVRDSTILINPVYTYKDNVTFAWIEDFEDLQVSMVKTTTSDTAMVITTNPDEVFEKNASGKIVITTEDEKDFFEMISDTSYILPQDGSPVVLEMDYNTQSVITVGVFAFDPLAHQVSVLNLNPTDGEWKKVYVYFTTAITNYINADNYKVFIGGYLDEDQDRSEIFIDNIKLLY